MAGPYDMPYGFAMPEPSPEERRASQLGFIANSLIGLGAGISQGGVRGIAPGLAMAGSLNARAQQQAEQERLRRWQLGMQQAAFDDKRRERELTREGLTAWAKANDPGTPGFNVQPSTIRMGPFQEKVGGDESGGDYTVSNRLGSGAYGKYQFMPDTWASVAQANPELKLPFNMRQATTEQQEQAMAALVRSNALALQNSGFQPNDTNLYLAHRFGVEGAKKVLTADPNQAISSLFPTIWTQQNPDMQGVSVGEFKGRVDQRYGGQQVAQGDAIPQGGGAVPSAPVLREIPRPTRLDPGEAAYLTQMASMPGVTIKQLEDAKQKLLDAKWTAMREQERARYQQESENYRFTRGQQAEQGRFERGLETEGEWVRGADGVERFIPKSQRQPGQVRYDKPGDDWYDMDEKEARMRLGPAYDPAKAYQRNRKDNKIVPVGGAQTVVNVDQKGEGEFSKEMGKLDAQRFAKIIEAEGTMNDMASKLGFAMDQFRQTYTGPGSETANYLNKILGAAGFEEAGKKANAADAAMAVISQMKPYMRAAGSGASSDKDMDMFARALPSLLNMQGGNERIVAFFQRMADRATRIRELAQEYSEGGKVPLTRTGFDDAVKKLGPLFTEEERKELSGLKAQAAPPADSALDRELKLRGLQ